VGDSRVNLDLVGKEYPEQRFTVERGHVERFSRALGASARIVPPTFVSAAEFVSFPAIVGDPELALDFSRVLHADQEYTFERPLRVGETLCVRSRIAGARAKGGRSFLTIETTLVDDAGATVVTARTTMLERGSA
jgi:acyl dehydratase